MTTTPPTRTKGSGGRGGGSGAPLATARRPVAALPVNDDDRVLNIEELYDLLRLEGAERCEASIATIPHAMCGTAQRWIKGQVMSHLALGGDARRIPTRHTRSARQVG